MIDPATPRLSVILITLNEERLLDRVLESVRWADEIVVVDSGSTDATAAIARRYTPHVHQRRYDGEGEQRLHALGLATGDWILALDGDEVVSPELADSIRAAIRRPDGNVGFRVQLHTWLLGTWIGTRGWRREWKLRLFSRGHGTFSRAPVHAGAEVAGRVGRLPGPLLHYPYRDLHHQVEKLNRYSTTMAAGSGGGSVLTAALRGWARFARDYLLGGDFLYGSAGFVRSVTSGYFTFLKHAKAWELHVSTPPDHDDT